MISGTFPMWMLNADYADISKDEISRQLDGLKRDGYAGVIPAIWGKEGYLSKTYFEVYGEILRALRAREMKCFVWDENHFPSGTSGARLDKQFQACYIDMEDYEDYRAHSESLADFAGAVLFDAASNRRTDVSLAVRSGKAPDCRAGERILVFTVKTQKEGLIAVDYLSAEAVRKLIDCNHEFYYEHYKEYFKTTVAGFFYDEPSFSHIRNGRIFTRKFAELFEKAKGYSPVTMYPALFLDVGEETAACRNALFGFRSELYAENYIGTLRTWCNERGILLTGHMDQEEAENPSCICGDLMKVIGSQDVPGVDEIWNYGRAKTAYKLASSAALNYGREQVMCEVFAAMGRNMPPRILFKEAIDLFSRGVDLLVPHGAWFDPSPKAVNAPPELSFRNPRFAAKLPQFNRLCRSLSGFLGGGNVAAEVAVLYPIETMYADTFFGSHAAYLGETKQFRASYYEVGETLRSKFHTDFIYLHPEVFLENCTLGDSKLSIRGNAEVKLLILTDYQVAGAGFLKKILKCLDSGVGVFFLGREPEFSSEPGVGNGEIAALMREIRGRRGYVYRESFGYYDVKDVLQSGLKNPDILFETDFDFHLGNFGYIHKKKGDREVYFFGNSSDYAASARVRISGLSQVEVFDMFGNPENRLRCKNFGGGIEFRLRLSAVSGLIVTGIREKA